MTRQEGYYWVIDKIKSYQNPYPKDLFDWNNKEDMKIKRGRFNEFCYLIAENIKQDLLRQIIDEVDEHRIPTPDEKLK